VNTKVVTAYRWRQDTKWVAESLDRGTPRATDLCGKLKR
jgi:hypothetical protein